MASSHVQTTRMPDSYQIIMRQHIEGRTMSVIDCDYLSEPGPITFPPELTLRIVRKAVARLPILDSLCAWLW